MKKVKENNYVLIILKLIMLKEVGNFGVVIFNLYVISIINI